ncbi:unnamed protein product [Microthlaspi erraticum]|uniref:Uncharacterized protein n=1 Tax=Microthlaspi erraticum TaxID=1685480 RepID=A0A6D2K409_9BRAS|nr:unnamed protein product [Microthlaspi erraticum]
MWRGILSTILLQSVQRSIYTTLSSFATTMVLETTPRRYNFQLSLAGQAKEWVNFNAQHAFKTWKDTKEAFLYRFDKGPIYVPPPRPSYSQHHPSSPDINQTLFPKESIKLRANQD